jgi:uncharacterized damage-inducible protein DinB
MISVSSIGAKISVRVYGVSTRRLAERHQFFLTHFKIWFTVWFQLQAPLRKVLDHVVTHGSYHRSQMTAMLRQLGHQGVSTDFIYFLDDV